MKNDLTNTEQLLQTYKQQSESLAERLRQEQASHREVCGYPNPNLKADIIVQIILFICVGSYYHAKEIR